MKFISTRAILLVVLVLSGCARDKTAKPTTTGASAGDVAPVASAHADSTNRVSAAKLIVTPDTALKAKVTSVNAAGRFVVLTFPLGRLPAADARFNLYRLGLKVGEVKINEWQHNDNVVADVVAGDAQIGDEAR